MASAPALAWEAEAARTRGSDGRGVDAMEASTRAGWADAEAPAGAEGGPDAATQVKDGIRDAADGVKSSAEDAAGHAKEKVAGAKQSLREQARDQISGRSTELGDRAQGAASDLRGIGEQLRSQGNDGPARAADQAADRVARAGDYLRDADADALLRDAEQFGRDRPWAVIAGGLAIGVAASRLLKASAAKRPETARVPQSSPPDGAGYVSRASQASTDAPQAATADALGGTSATAAPTGGTTLTDAAVLTDPSLDSDGPGMSDTPIDVGPSPGDASPVSAGTAASAGIAGSAGIDGSRDLDGTR